MGVQVAQKERHQPVTTTATAAQEFPRKIFGIGFNKTGTSTLGTCFDILGLTPVARPQALHDRFQVDSFRRYFPDATLPPLAARHGEDQSLGPFGAYPYRAICDEILDHQNHELAIQIAASFQAFHDRPWNVANLYKSLDEAFPGSRFILTWREPEDWWRSTSHWLTSSHPEDHAKLGRYLRHLGTERVDKDKFIGGYRDHNEAIRAYFGQRTDFLSINFEQGDGWLRLCTFLGLPIPNCEFPHENRQNYREFPRNDLPYNL